MLRRVAIPESVTCKGLAPVSRTTLVTIVEANQRRFLKQSRTLFAYNLNKFPVDTIGVKEKRTLTSREESDIEVIVRQLIQHFEEFFKSKAVTPTESGVDELVKKYSDIMMPIINSKSFYRFKGDLRYILPISMSVEGFEMRVRNAFIDPRPPLVRIFDAAPTFYGCATFLSAATCKSLEDRSQLLESEFATAPLVQTPLLQELKTWINGTGKKTLLVSGSSGSGKTTSVIGLGSIQDGLNQRTAVLVSLPTDAGQFPGIASKQRELDRAKAKQKCLQGMQDRNENSPEAHRSLNLKYLALGVEDALMNLQDTAASHLHSLPDNKTKESDLSETDETGASAAFGRALSDARLQAKREFAKTDNADIYTSKTILGCLCSAPEGVDCKPVEEAIFMLVTSLSAQIPSAVDTEQVLEQQKTVVVGLEAEREQSVLNMLIGLIKRIAGEDVFWEMGLLTENETMRLVVFLDEMGGQAEVVRALCSFPVSGLVKAINKDKRVSVTLIAGGTGVGCRQHPDGSNVDTYKVFYAAGGDSNRNIFKASFGNVAKTFENFKDSLVIKIDDLLPAIDSNARLAFTLGRFAKDAAACVSNASADKLKSQTGRQVAIDYKGMLQMAAIKWKSLNGLEKIPANKMFRVLVDALTMYLFPNSYDSDTELKFGLLVDKATWEYDDKTKTSRLHIPDTGRYDIDPYLVHLLCMTCDIDQVTHSMSSGGTLEQYFQVVLYLLACAAKDDEALVRLLTAGNEKYQRQLSESGNDEMPVGEDQRKKKKKRGKKNSTEKDIDTAQYSVGPITEEELGGVKIPSTEKDIDTAQYRVGPITEEELGGVKIPTHRPITAVFREFPQEYSYFLRNVTHGLNSLFLPGSTEVTEMIPIEASSHNAKSPAEKAADKQKDFDESLTTLNKKPRPDSDQCYIACFRTPEKFSFADLILFIGHTLLLVQVKDHQGEGKDIRNTYILERQKMGAYDTLAEKKRRKNVAEKGSTSSTADVSPKDADPKDKVDADLSRKRVQHLKKLWREATGQQITKVRFCFATSRINGYADVREAVTGDGMIPTDSDIFLSAAGISFLQFNPNRKLRHYVQMTKQRKLRK